MIASQPARRSPPLLLMTLAAVVALWGCGGGGEPNPEGPGAGGAAGAGGLGGAGAGGSGGADGGGGSEAPGGTGGAAWEIEPWDDDLELGQRWRHQGFGETFSLAAADFLGNGELQLAVGGRRPMLLGGDGAEVLWFRDWPANDQLLRRGDNDWVYQLAPIANERGAHDLLITTSDLSGAALLDGRDGSEIWSLDALDTRFPFPHFTLFGAPAAPSFFPAYGRAAYAASTGEERWRLEREEFHAYVVEARRGAEEPTGLYLVSEGEKMIGFGGTRWTSFPSLLSVDSEGEELFTVTFRDGDEGLEPVAVVAADLDGDRIDSVVVAFHGEPIRAYGPDGTLRWEKRWLHWGADPTRTRILEVLAYDLDGDGREELIVFGADAWMYGIEGGGVAFWVLDADGNDLYSVDFDLPLASAKIVQFDDAAPLLLIGTGTSYLPMDGQLLAVRLDPTLEDMTVFRFPMPAQASALTLLGSGRDLALSIGSDDGILRTIDSSGELLWDHHLGSFFSAAASVPDPGRDDLLAFGDDAGTLALLDAAGQKRWYRFLDVGSYGRVEEIVTARLEAGGDTSIVAAASATKECCGGTLEAFSIAGERILERALPGAPFGLAAADLDQDGVDELIVLEGMRSSSDRCRLRAYRSDGSIFWETPIAVCEIGSISVDDMDGAGSPSIGVLTRPILLPVPATLSVVAADGTLRWLWEEVEQGTNWIEATPQGLLGGGRAVEEQGFVELRDPEEGERRWRTVIPGRPDPVNEGLRIPGYTSYGTAFSYRGAFGVALSTWANDLLLVEGSSGEVLWSTFTEDPEHWVDQRHRGGPVYFVEESDAAPPHLLFAQDDSSRRRSTAMVLSLDGVIQSSQQLFSPATRIVPARCGDAICPVVKTLLGLHSFELAPAAP